VRNLQTTLEYTRTTLESNLKVTVYLSDFDEFGEFNQVYGDYCEVDYPARTSVQAGKLGHGVLVEIEAIALLPDEQ
jgi:2-iminobutanoate/2-iminopropanoate deaminase